MMSAVYTATLDLYPKSRGTEDTGNTMIKSDKDISKNRKIYQNILDIMKNVQAAEYCRSKKNTNTKPQDSNTFISLTPVPHPDFPVQPSPQSVAKNIERGPEKKLEYELCKKWMLDLSINPEEVIDSTLTKHRHDNDSPEKRDPWAVTGPKDESKRSLSETSLNEAQQLKHFKVDAKIISKDFTDSIVVKAKSEEENHSPGSETQYTELLKHFMSLYYPLHPPVIFQDTSSKKSTFHPSEKDSSSHRHRLSVTLFSQTYEYISEGNTVTKSIESFSQSIYEFLTGLHELAFSEIGKESKEMILPIMESLKAYRKDSPMISDLFSVQGEVKLQLNPVIALSMNKLRELRKPDEETTSLFGAAQANQALNENIVRTNMDGNGGGGRAITLIHEVQQKYLHLDPPVFEFPIPLENDNVPNSGATKYEGLLLWLGKVWKTRPGEFYNKKQAAKEAVALIACIQIQETPELLQAAIEAANANSSLPNPITTPIESSAKMEKGETKAHPEYKEKNSTSLSTLPKLPESVVNMFRKAKDYFASSDRAEPSTNSSLSPSNATDSSDFVLPETLSMGHRYISYMANACQSIKRPLPDYQISNYPPFVGKLTWNGMLIETKKQHLRKADAKEELARLALLNLAKEMRWGENALKSLGIPVLPNSKLDESNSMQEKERKTMTDSKLLIQNQVQPSIQTYHQENPQVQPSSSGKTKTLDIMNIEEGELDPYPPFYYTSSSSNDTMEMTPSNSGKLKKKENPALMTSTSSAVDKYRPSSLVDSNERLYHEPEMKIATTRYCKHDIPFDAPCRDCYEMSMMEFLKRKERRLEILEREKMLELAKLKEERERIHYQSSLVPNFPKDQRQTFPSVMYADSNSEKRYLPESRYKSLYDDFNDSIETSKMTLLDSKGRIQRSEVLTREHDLFSYDGGYHRSDDFRLSQTFSGSLDNRERAIFSRDTTIGLNMEDRIKQPLIIEERSRQQLMFEDKIKIPGHSYGTKTVIQQQPSLSSKKLSLDERLKMFDEYENAKGR